MQMLEEQIKDLLFLRLKKLGYHLIRVKLINLLKKKHCRLWQSELKIKK